MQLEQLLGDRFQLITQNVDRLHLRAGNSPARTFEIHGHIDFMRCSKECSRELLPIPEAITPKQRGQDIPDAEWNLLKCPRCRNLTRPHVLWFDESYNEYFYRVESSLKAAAHTGLLLIAGTSGATNLPRHIVRDVLAHKGAVIDINTEPDFFAKQVKKQDEGHVIQGKCGEVFPQLLEIFKRAAHN